MFSKLLRAVTGASPQSSLSSPQTVSPPAARIPLILPDPPRPPPARAGDRRPAARPRLASRKQHQQRGLAPHAPAQPREQALLLQNERTWLRTGGKSAVRARLGGLRRGCWGRCFLPFGGSVALRPCRRLGNQARQPPARLGKSSRPRERRQAAPGKGG